MVFVGTCKNLSTEELQGKNWMEKVDVYNLPKHFYIQLKEIYSSKFDTVQVSRTNTLSLKPPAEAKETGKGSPFFLFYVVKTIGRNKLEKKKEHKSNAQPKTPEIT